MLPTAQKILFAIFALVTSAIGARGFYRLYRRIAVGRTDTDQRLDHLPRRVFYALTTTLTQSRTFRKRPVISFFHSLIFYGFAFYLLVNLIDGIEGFFPFALRSVSTAGAAYNLLADLLSAGVLSGVVALVIRRFALPSRQRLSLQRAHAVTPRCEAAICHSRLNYRVDVHFVSRRQSRACCWSKAGAGRSGSLSAICHPDLAFLLSAKCRDVACFGYWGALGSVLVFLAYFPYSKHIHIFMAPAKYLVARTVTSGVLPAVAFGAELESQDR